MGSSRKVATGLQLINWARFANVRIKMEGSTLITGHNGTGKTTVLDAITYLLTGNTHFNIAAKDRDRNVLAYVNGDTHSEGNERYLRGNMDVVSYIAMEFYSPVDKAPMVVFVSIELKKDDTKTNSYWYVAKDASLDDITFCDEKEGKLLVYPKSQIMIKGRNISNKEFMSMEKGTQQVLQAMGLRCKVNKYKSKLIKMMAFDPQKNIDKFIQESVLEEGVMSSLADLKEQRTNYDEIKQTYEDMLESKKVLEQIEVCARDYEQKYAEYHKRRLMLGYQRWQVLAQAIENLKDQKGREEAALKLLNEKKGRKDKEFDEARQKLEEINNRPGFSDIQGALKRLDDEVEKYTKESENLVKSVETIRVLQEWINVVLGRYSEEMQSISDVEALNTLLVEGDTTRKVTAFYSFAEAIKKLIEHKKLAKLRNIDQIDKDDNTRLERLETKKQLEGSKFVFGVDYEKTRALISEELKKQNIVTDVKFFVELISKVKDKRWRKAIETFLGGKRFNIIVDPKYTAQVLRIVNDNPAHKGKVVITDKLEETDVVVGSAAEQLDIVNPSARMYANYLLNGIHLCESVEELHEYPKGGIMPNGMLAKGYAVGKMDINNTKLFIGQDAIQLQLEDLVKEIEDLESSIQKHKEDNDCILKELAELEEKSLKQEDYNFEAVNEIRAVKDKLHDAIGERDILTNNPSFTAILEEIERAKENYKKLDREKSALSETIGGSRAEIKEIKTEIVTKTQEMKEAQKDFERDCKEMPELKQPVIDMYSQQILKKGTVITKRTVDDWAGYLDSARKALEDAHLTYCKINGADNQMRGVSFIGHYRQLYRSLANVQIEEAKQKLEKQGEKLQSAFVGDFVAEINETIKNAQEEIDKINKELKNRPFGNDIYQFKMEERLDSEGKALFFKICKQMHQYFDNAEYYLSAVKDDEDSEQDIKEFIDIVLNEEDETEYTDYRKYFTYDMRIISKQGDEEIQATLSKKQGSASNGEKQTPYFIILAASLLQLYPKDRSSARLAFIDEAFSVLSRERIEQMVDYLETNDFQVVYAAPQEKIYSIGSHIQTTTTLIAKGRQSFAAEGLVMDPEE